MKKVGVNTQANMTLHVGEFLPLFELNCKWFSEHGSRLCHLCLPVSEWVAGDKTGPTSGRDRPVQVWLIVNKGSQPELNKVKRPIFLPKSASSRYKVRFLPLSIPADQVHTIFRTLIGAVPSLTESSFEGPFCSYRAPVLDLDSWYLQMMSLRLSCISNYFYGDQENHLSSPQMCAPLPQPSLLPLHFSPVET